MHTHMFQKMSEAGLTRNQESVFRWDMDNKQKGTGCLTQFKEKCNITQSEQHQVDLTTAFLNGNREEVYMTQRKDL